MKKRERRIAERVYGSSSSKKDSSEQKAIEEARAAWEKSSAQWKDSSASASQTPVETSYGGGWDDTNFEPPEVPESAESRDFLKKIQGIKGKTIKDIVALIPADATGQVSSYTVPGIDRQGFSFAWKSPQQEQWKVNVAAPNQNSRITIDDALVNSVKDWTVRVQRNNEHMDLSGQFHPSRKANSGVYGVEEIINDTHIPIKTPEGRFINPVTSPYAGTPWGDKQIAALQGMFKDHNESR